MAIAILGQIVGAAGSVLHLVNGAEEMKQHDASPDHLLINAPTPEAQQKVVAVIDHLAGEGPLAAALAALSPEVGHLDADDQELVNWLKLYRHFKADLADNGRIDNPGQHLAEMAEILHAGDLVKGWAGGLVDRLMGRGK